MKTRFLVSYLLVFSLLWGGCRTTETPKPAAGSTRGAVGANGMVVSAHPEATRIGLEILKKGGNAYDAAVATGFALAVAFPVAGNIGGGGFLVYRKHNGEIGALDYREKAPAAATRDMYLDAQGNVRPDASTLGHLAVGVPGAVDGLFTMHQKLGSLSWAEVVQPSIDLAQKGVVLTEKEARGLNQTKEEFVRANKFPTHLVREKPWQQGDVLPLPELAKTLERIRDNGRAGFYEGETATLLVKEMNRGGGIISAQDLKNYQSVWRTPVTGSYKGYKVISMPPPSSGGVALVQLLKMVEPYDLSGWGWQSANTVHVMVEAERRVYADRATYLGDPDFFQVPVDKLLAPAYLRQRMSSLQMQNATPSDQIMAGKLLAYESDQTTHYSIVDKWGNAASITTTLNGNYGSKVVVEGAGFLLNNEMDDFSAKPGVPNMFGLIGGEANAIAPGKRMLSSMTPTIVEKEGQLHLVVGTPGGSTIITSVFQTVLNVLEHGMTMQEAVNAPRFHHQWLPDRIEPEPKAIASQVREELQKRGHQFQGRSAIGRVDGILRLPNGSWEGGADPRGDDAAAGY
ncbi:gamma-glutamyltransferase [Rufibacter quisquiliarum]|uniref:Glutathione hydrolase proenzyme n=1 Tax=Rufibacter quisquiliarum TaxID=1549639 RepID=A0A839GDN7_9BACT|nr:gamma-glutamyltransferase [Rufibacter quisquiliarum]MBA9075643.1 gamma-glutamyltranspeptidase/glutathione hydrolase [Rufibacter quisquiliarum]